MKAASPNPPGNQMATCWPVVRRGRCMCNVWKAADGHMTAMVGVQAATVNREAENRGAVGSQRAESLGPGRPPQPWVPASGPRWHRREVASVSFKPRYWGGPSFGGGPGPPVPSRGGGVHLLLFARALRTATGRGPLRGRRRVVSGARASAKPAARSVLHRDAAVWLSDQQPRGANDTSSLCSYDARKLPEGPAVGSQSTWTVAEAWGSSGAVA